MLRSEVADVDAFAAADREGPPTGRTASLEMARTPAQRSEATYQARAERLADTAAALCLTPAEIGVRPR